MLDGVPQRDALIASSVERVGPAAHTRVILTTADVIPSSVFSSARAPAVSLSSKLSNRALTSDLKSAVARRYTIYFRVYLEYWTGS